MISAKRKIADCAASFRSRFPASASSCLSVSTCVLQFAREMFHARQMNKHRKYKRTSVVKTTNRLDLRVRFAQSAAKRVHYLLTNVVSMLLYILLSYFLMFTLDKLR